MRSRPACRPAPTRSLPQGEVELTRSRAPLMTEPLPAAAILWVTALTAQVLPEHQAYPSLYDGLDGLLEAVARGARRQAVGGRRCCATNC